MELLGPLKSLRGFLDDAIKNHSMYVQKMDNEMQLEETLGGIPMTTDFTVQLYTGLEQAVDQHATNSEGFLLINQFEEAAKEAKKCDKYDRRLCFIEDYLGSSDKGMHLLNYLTKED